MNNSFLKNILFFDKMYITKIIQIIYILFVILSIIGGIILCFTKVPTFSGSSFSDFYYEETSRVFEGIMLIIFGPLFARIWAESVIIIFKIYEKTSKISELKEKEQNN